MIASHIPNPIMIVQTVVSEWKLLPCCASHSRPAHVVGFAPTEKVIVRIPLVRTESNQRRKQFPILKTGGVACVVIVYGRYQHEANTNIGSTLKPVDVEIFTVGQAATCSGAAIPDKHEVPRIVSLRECGTACRIRVSLKFLFIIVSKDRVQSKQAYCVNGQNCWSSVEPLLQKYPALPAGDPPYHCTAQICCIDA